MRQMLMGVVLICWGGGKFSHVKDIGSCAEPEVMQTQLKTYGVRL